MVRKLGRERERKGEKWGEKVKVKGKRGKGEKGKKE